MIDKKLRCGTLKTDQETTYQDIAQLHITARKAEVRLPFFVRIVIEELWISSSKMYQSKNNYGIEIDPRQFEFYISSADETAKLENFLFILNFQLHDAMVSYMSRVVNADTIEERKFWNRAAFQFADLSRQYRVGYRLWEIEKNKNK